MATVDGQVIGVAGEAAADAASVLAGVSATRAGERRERIDPDAASESSFSASSSARRSGTRPSEVLALGDLEPGVVGVERLLALVERQQRLDFERGGGLVSR